MPGSNMVHMEEDDLPVNVATGLVKPWVGLMRE